VIPSIGTWIAVLEIELRLIVRRLYLRDLRLLVRHNRGAGVGCPRLRVGELHLSRARH
jgi:hypothetical protein